MTKHPKVVNPTRLQQVVFDLESKKVFQSVDELAETAAKSTWATTSELDAGTIRAALIYHETITKVDKPAKDTQPEPQTQEAKGAGRGRKQCPTCHNYVGVRTRQCDCGYEFGKANGDPPVHAPKQEPKTEAVAPPPPKEPKEEPRPSHIRRQGVWTPAGAAPAKLAGTSEDEVYEWAEKVLAHGERVGKHYLVQALIYWVREFYDINGPEFPIVKAHLLNLYSGEAA